MLLLPSFDNKPQAGANKLYIFASLSINQFLNFFESSTIHHETSDNKSYFFLALTINHTLVATNRNHKLEAINRISSQLRQLTTNWRH